MPVTGPRPSDVAFDHAAASRAVTALDHATAVLAAVAEARAGSGATARQHFRGRAAQTFRHADHDLGAASNDARRAVAALRSAIAAAAEAARRAQAARVADQRAWDAAHVHPPPVGVR